MENDIMAQCRVMDAKDFLEEAFGRNEPINAVSIMSVLLSSNTVIGAEHAV